MRKLKFINVVIPELVSYLIHGNEKIPDYRCPECGYGVADDYVCCPHCGVWLNWKKEDEDSHAFRMLMENK